MLSRLATCSACPALLLLLYADTNIKNLWQYHHHHSHGPFLFRIITSRIWSACKMTFFEHNTPCMFERKRKGMREQKNSLTETHFTYHYKMSALVSKQTPVSLRSFAFFLSPSCNRVVSKEESCSIVFGFAFYANGIRFACSTLSGSEGGYIYSITWCSNDPSCFQSIVFDRLSFLLYGCWFFLADATVDDDDDAAPSSILI